jgi:hypothetical protein
VKLRTGLLCGYTDNSLHKPTFVMESNLDAPRVKYFFVSIHRADVRCLAETSDLPQHTNSSAQACVQKRKEIIMTFLSPMRADVFPSYLESAIAGYAEDCVASHRWPSEGAIERSRADFESGCRRGW